jgi:hypothetical protein
MIDLVVVLKGGERAIVPPMAPRKAAYPNPSPFSNPDLRLGLYRPYTPSPDPTITIWIPPNPDPPRDVSLDNFSVSNGGKDLISDATLMLAFGRRYGLVGRNGTGARAGPERGGV